MGAATLELLPLPRRIERTPHGLVLGRTVTLTGADSPALDRLVESLRAQGIATRRAERGEITLAVDGTPGAAPEGYVLTIGPEGARVLGHDPAGLSHGTHTLAQLVAACGPELPGLAIEDAPSFAHRGAMLDVSRDRVPTMETLFALVDRFSAWKLNELQLYVEHTFAYRDHEPVWRDASPLTHDEVRALDEHCAARHVRLVPNQQCFGHLHHWLRHERYRHLAECPQGVEHPFLSPSDPPGPEPFSLAATDSASLDFVAGLLAELLPAFRADTVNVGCDETFDLGLGRSREACREQGVGRVYLAYLQGLERLLRERFGKRMQVWADILLAHPELVPELPRGVIPLLWGYEAEHPFEAQTARLRACGLPFYVCPGTSSWQSLAGRFTNAVRNVESAVRHGRTNGAVGVLVTDWGDRGHLQPLVASYPGWLAAADLAWNADAPAERRAPDAMAELVSRHALDERPPRGGGAGRALVSLARMSEATGARIANASPLSVVLTRVLEDFPPAALVGLTAEGLDHAAHELELARAALADATAGPGTRDELAWIADTLAFALELSRARLAAGAEVPVRRLAPERRAELARLLAPVLAGHGPLWARRSRPGGRRRSAAWLERVADQLRGAGASESGPAGTT